MSSLNQVGCCRPRRSSRDDKTAVLHGPICTGRDPGPLDAHKLLHEILCVERRCRAGAAVLMAQSREGEEKADPSPDHVDSLIGLGREAHRRGQSWVNFYREHSLCSLHSRVRTKIRIAAGWPSPHRPHQKRRAPAPAHAAIP
jgi:hypothetical protein